MKKLFAIILMATMLLSAFGGAATLADETAYKKSVTVALDANISSLDVMTNSSATNDFINKATYNQLLYFNWDTKEIEPELAESWEVEAADSYLFHLRQDVTFSNGEPLTADDVYYSVST